MQDDGSHIQRWLQFGVKGRNHNIIMPKKSISGFAKLQPQEIQMSKRCYDINTNE